MIKILVSFTLSMMVLGLTACLILANPLIYGFEYGMKKGWIKINPRR